MENKRVVNILIAEDVDSNFLYLEAVLSKIKARVIWARNGVEAVDLVSKGKDIDLILMDLHMPELDGFEATKIIRKDFPGIPIIAQTAFAMSADREKVLEAGFDDYIAKPINSQVLLTMVIDIVSKRSGGSV